MLSEEAEYWWDNARQRLETASTEITWDKLKKKIMVKYFSAAVRNKEGIEFLDLK